ncbi:dipeptidase [Pseudoduganella namucuonensis]|uniref:Membrane dipeptidase n=1 Tax=Pseudoduganella namucuonensis TaxID=1035707 RepID=A0A1I7JL39_9BURK|nr:membrane dipeptidase [Pseudoduganella namucuonensis]SFU85867.1 membrane dipeptidase [Pseudoduganella namucuonensis]
MINWDAHICLPQHPLADFSPVDQLRAAGVNYLSLNVGADMNPLSQVMSVIAGYRATIAANPERYVLASTVDDIIQAAADGKLAIGFDLEGSLPLLEQPDMAALYRELGVRQILLAYNRNNDAADGCHDEARGLTPLGYRMVEAINDAGILMDCAHSGRLCSLDVMAASSKPVIFSHANAYALTPHGRNVTDEQILACAATGGVVCVSGLSWFLGSDKPCAADVARHAAYIAELAGVEHVGIGLDICFQQKELDDTPPGGFDPSYWWPASAGYSADSPPTFTPPDVWRTLGAELRKVGMSVGEVEMVLGRNMMRVAQQTWRHA